MNATTLLMTNLQPVAGARELPQPYVEQASGNEIDLSKPFTVVLPALRDINFKNAWFIFTATQIGEGGGKLVTVPIVYNQPTRYDVINGDFTQPFTPGTTAHVMYLIESGPLLSRGPDSIEYTFV